MSNMWTRLISGLIFLGIVIGGLLINEYLYGALMLFLTVTMLTEFYRMTLGDAHRKLRLLSTVFGACIFISTFVVFKFHVDPKFLALNFIFVIALMTSSLYDKDKGDFRQLGCLYTGLVYISLPLALANVIAFGPEGEFKGIAILSMMIIIWSGDVGAYLFGMLLGKNGKKLSPEISPNKSWAGFWGGLGCAALAGAVLCLTGMWTFPIIHSIAAAVVMYVAGVYGDLFESQWKRVCGVKDSGKIMPGHGGMLDRFDSAIFAIPSGAFYLVLMGLV